MINLRRKSQYTKIKKRDSSEFLTSFLLLQNNEVENDIKLTRIEVSRWHYLLPTEGAVICDKRRCEAEAVSEVAPGADVTAPPEHEESLEVDFAEDLLNLSEEAVQSTGSNKTTVAPSAIVNLKKEQESTDVATPRHEDRSENAKNGTENSTSEGTSTPLKLQESEKEAGNPVKEELSDNTQG